MNDDIDKFDKYSIRELEALDGIIHLRYPSNVINIDFDNTLQPTSCWITINNFDVYVIFVYELDYFTTFTDINIINAYYTKYSIDNKRKIEKN